MPIIGTVPTRKATPAKSSAAKANEARQTVHTRVDTRAESLNGLFQMASVAMLMRKQLADAAAIADHGPNISREAALIAEQNPEFAKVLDYLSKVGPYTGLVTACLPLILQIMANHKMMIVEGLTTFGIVPPEVLEAKTKAEAAHKVAELMQQASDMQAHTDAMRDHQNAATNGA